MRLQSTAGVNSVQETFLLHVVRLGGNGAVGLLARLRSTRSRVDSRIIAKGCALRLCSETKEVQQSRIRIGVTQDV